MILENAQAEVTVVIPTTATRIAKTEFWLFLPTICTLSSQTKRPIHILPESWVKFSQTPFKAPIWAVKCRRQTQTP